MNPVFPYSVYALSHVRHAKEEIRMVQLGVLSSFVKPRQSLRSILGKYVDFVPKWHAELIDQAIEAMERNAPNDALRAICTYEGLLDRPAQ